MYWDFLKVVYFIILKYSYQFQLMAFNSLSCLAALDKSGYG